MVTKVGSKIQEYVLVDGQPAGLSVHPRAADTWGMYHWPGWGWLPPGRAGRANGSPPMSSSRLKAGLAGCWVGAAVAGWGGAGWGARGRPGWGSTGWGAGAGWAWLTAPGVWLLGGEASGLDTGGAGCKTVREHKTFVCASMTEITENA